MWLARADVLSELDDRTGRVMGKMLDLHRKVSFVRGAGSVAEGWGNGRATAVLMARPGAKVFGTDYGLETLAGTAATMDKERHRDWACRQADMTRREDVQRTVEESLAHPQAPGCVRRRSSRRRRPSGGPWRAPMRCTSV